jgi:hypothetical protein
MGYLCREGCLSDYECEGDGCYCAEPDELLICRSCEGVGLGRARLFCSAG